MSKPRPLNEKELQFLRRLAFRKGVPEHKHSQDKQVIELVLKRGLAEDVEHRCGTRIAITKSGMIEVAKSGRFTPYDPALVMERYSAILPKLKAKLSNMSLRRVGLQEWWNPDEPWELSRNLTFLRKEQDLWRESSGIGPTSLLSDVLDWYEVELRGDVGFANNLYSLLVADLNKE